MSDVSKINETVRPLDASDWPSAAELHRRYLHLVIERHDGNKTQAAEALGIDRRTVNRQLAAERRRQAAGGRR